MLQFRPRTIDRMIYNAIHFANEYRLPPSFNAEDIILDIGAHAGYFAQCVLEKGAGKVISVEAEQENYALAQQHLAEYIASGRAELIFGAAWRSDNNEDILYHSGHTYFSNHPLRNTGGGDVLWQTDGEVVPQIAFDDLLWQATDQGRRSVRLLKLDCEGSEWPILLTSKRLHLVEEICGEYHEIGGAYDQLDLPPWNFGHTAYTEQLIKKFLTSAGFKVETYRHQDAETHQPERLGMFFARRVGGAVN